ncbi:hypothetical protein DL546_000008, partial [Coniochaeta pulveracea]
MHSRLGHVPLGIQGDWSDIKDIFVWARDFYKADVDGYYLYYREVRQLVGNALWKAGWESLFPWDNFLRLAADKVSRAFTHPLSDHLTACNAMMAYLKTRKSKAASMTSTSTTPCTILIGDVNIEEWADLHHIDPIAAKEALENIEEIKKFWRRVYGDDDTYNSAKRHQLDADVRDTLLDETYDSEDAEGDATVTEEDHGLEGPTR